MSDLVSKTCKPCEGGVTPLNDDSVRALLPSLNNWNTNGTAIFKEFSFKSYYQTIAFVNAVAWMAHKENHHPNLSVGFKQCVVQYTTHAINGLSENDFICAAKVDALVS
ncbi:MAG: 4a-hydroxytetrahydrobiopterin dehydratase [bacterium]|nr:4a-hydroxytetrahydrobiopterin dehydratase [bacterium]